MSLVGILEKIHEKSQFCHVNFQSWDILIPLIWHTQSMIACGLNALILGKGQFFKEDFITSKMLNKRMNPNPRLCAQ